MDLRFLTTGIGATIGTLYGRKGFAALLLVALSLFAGGKANAFGFAYDELFDQDYSSKFATGLKSASDVEVRQAKVPNTKPRLSEPHKELLSFGYTVSVPCELEDSKLPGVDAGYSGLASVSPRLEYKIFATELPMLYPDMRECDRDTIRGKLFTILKECGDYEPAKINTPNHFAYRTRYKEQGLDIYGCYVITDYYVIALLMASDYNADEEYKAFIDSFKRTTVDDVESRDDRYLTPDDFVSWEEIRARHPNIDLMRDIRQKVRNPLAGKSKTLFGDSMWDPKVFSSYEYENAQDVREENQQEGIRTGIIIGLTIIILFVLLLVIINNGKRET